MYRSRKPAGANRTHRAFSRLPLTAAIWLAVSGAAYAQDATQPPATTDQPPETTAQQAQPAPAAPSQRTATLETITVTAQKRTENLQKVPISIQVLGTEQLEELNVSDFDDYVKFLPSVSYTSGGPGFAQVYMRGVASGGDGNHSGSLPSVGIYLDEQPVTTIQGALDIHMYDINRVEVLSGPQGTLYGASAQAGALRIITNKPDPSGFEAGYSVETNTVSHGGVGYSAEGFVNVPLTEAAALRAVGWHQHDAGFIDNKAGTRTFPSSGITISNARDCVPGPSFECHGRAKDDYNDMDTTGARMALKVDLNDNWTITPGLMAQKQKENGVFFTDPQVGERAVTHFYPERSDDRWWQAALTVEGKIGNFDLTYAYAHLKRDVDVDSDYNDYSFWYDTLAGYGAYICDDFDPNTFTCTATGSLINPSQYIQGKDRYKKDSHELRLASPSEDRLRFVVGLFWQTQKHDIEQRYRIDGLSPQQSITGWEDTLWLTKQEREDHDEAVFGELSFDFIPDKLTGTIGARHFRADNSLKGFFGFADWGWVSSYGEAICPAGAPTFNGAPCKIFDKNVKEKDTLGKANLTWNITPTKMIYGTWSEGYRPGGINRRGTLPPYLTDWLTNYELGWKTSWMDNRVVFNGSVFRQEWKDFQFSILGANGLTEIKNANQARIDGLEMDLNWAATYNLHIGAGAAFYDAQLTENYCGFTDSNGKPVTDCPAPEAAEGTQLPVTPKFKGTLTARYTFNVGSMDAYWQLAGAHVGKRRTDLRDVENDILGELDAYNLADLSFGFGKDNWNLDFYVNNLFDEVAEMNKFTLCAESFCGAKGVVPEYPNGQIYTAINQPRTFGVKFSQKF
ncbi:TonB-dependent receptor [Lysobacter terrae]